jgi:protein transport protein HofQ
MNNQKHTKTVFCYIIFALAAWGIQIQSRPLLATQNASLPVGRMNPFANITKPTNPSPVTELLTSLGSDDRPELFMQTIMLKFLDAKSLQQAVSKMSSEYGTVAVNQKNNSLIICDTKEHLARILSEIDKADRTPQQIMIEVVIVDVQLRDRNEIGVNWDLLSDKNYDYTYRQNFTNRLGSTVADADTIGNATAFNTTGIGGDFSVISGTIRNVVSMLQTKRDVEILASPRAMMVSGESANIKAVEEIPYNEVSDTAAGGVGAITSTKFKEVGVNLQVNATVTDGNNIFLTVDTEQNARTSESPTGVPVVDTRRASTALLLKDGQIVVIGGLRRQETTKEVNQIPILGDIPLVGLLFKYTNTVVNNTELIVFLSPHIYKEGEPIPKDAMSKFNEITSKPMLLLPEEAKLREHRDQLQKHLDEQATTAEKLRLEIARRRQAERDAKKKILLKRMNELKNKRDDDSVKELVSTLASLDEILSQEIHEALSASKKVLADEGK